MSIHLAFALRHSRLSLMRHLMRCRLVASFQLGTSFVKGESQAHGSSWLTCRPSGLRSRQPARHLHPRVSRQLQGQAGRPRTPRPSSAMSGLPRNPSRSFRSASGLKCQILCLDTPKQALRGPSTFRLLNANAVPKNIRGFYEISCSQLAQNVRKHGLVQGCDCGNG